jgi:hypothetical protein
MKLRNTILMLFVCLAAGLSSCKDKDKAKENTAAALSGSGSKSWHISKQKDASGDKVDLSDAEEKEKMIFNSDGTFTMIHGKGQETGTWKYEGKNLSLHFSGENKTETFNVEEATDEKLVLKAPGGEEMRLKAD